MSGRSFLNVGLAMAFLGLSITGIWLFFSKHESQVIILHIVLGALFLLSALIHLSGNWLAFKRYLRKRYGQLSMLLGVLVALMSFTNVIPLNKMGIEYAKLKTSNSVQSTDESFTEVYLFSETPNMILELRADKHFWFPQIAVWITDSTDQYLQTMMVTHSTAKGHFIGGRTKENFKSFDGKKSNMVSSLRRVDALPYWSHKRGIPVEDGGFAPSPNRPLPDAITGATPSGSFQLHSRFPKLRKFNIYLEVNVAFDDNKYYSVYDYPDDSLYHSGTGLLGQPSVIYSAEVDLNQNGDYFIMKYLGHTHPSGNSGRLYNNQDGLTTALDIIDLALLKVISDQSE